MKITTEKEAGIIIAETTTGLTILTMEEAHSIYVHMRKMYFESFLQDIVNVTIENEEIDLSKFNGTEEDFIEEVKSCLENRVFYEIEDATQEQIEEATIDTAEYYDLF